MLAGERGGSPGVPPLVERSPVPGAPVLGRLVGRVAGAHRQVQHEALVRLHVAEVGDELDRPVGQIGAEVVAGRGRAGRGDPVVVVGEGRLELVGLAAEEAVEALEPAPERPRRTRRPEVEVLVGGEVPLADGVGRVPVGHGELGEHPG